jgi:uncharacterized damage-inducible protein DinB
MSPVKKKRAKRRAGSKKAKKRSARAKAKPRRAAAKKAKKRRAGAKARPRRSVAKKAGKRRVTSKKKPVKRTKAATRAKRKGARPALRIVRRPAKRAARKPAPRRPAPPPAFPQAAGASEKQRVMFALVRARTAVSAAIQGTTAGSAEQAMGEGKWSMKETILHLATRDRIRLRELEAALRGVQPSWAGISDEEQSRVNEQDLAALRHLSWEDAVRLLHSTREELLEAIESVPEEPAETWRVEHPFGWMMQRLPAHDTHHADVIKRWRAEAGA